MTPADLFAALSLIVSLALLVGLVLVWRRTAPADTTSLLQRLDGLERAGERTDRSLRDELALGRRESGETLATLRQELQQSFSALGEALGGRVTQLATLQQQQLEAFGRDLKALTETTERKAEDLRRTVDQQLVSLREGNERKLEQMRQTVDEKLQRTLEERLGESFRLVSERLEEVHRGLGEMRTLATGVGDLKRVLTNVKARGEWGEVQLGALLEQVLAPDQYASNVATREGTAERVEFAVRLPGPEGREHEVVWLPIDAKFPLEDYQRLAEAAERADGPAVDQAARELEARIKQAARELSTKYLEPPKTTDFAIMFLPTEGLYAEILRRPGLTDTLQREHRVLVAGPTTLWAILSSLRLGFRTFAIQKRSSEIWALLGQVKNDFSRFGRALDAVRKKLDEAQKKVDLAQKGTRRIEQRLSDVQEPPGLALDVGAPQGTPLLDLAGDDEVEDEGVGE
jgi:DNA recombination protein RmuC